MPYSRWHKLLADPRYSPSSGLLRDYLKLCDGMESPTPYHVWSFISLFAALAGGRIFIDRGALGKLRLNMGIVLMGFPAVRKSKAIDVMNRFSQGLPLQYGPTDTAGQRQGIMAAMMPRWQYDSLEDKEKEEFDLGEASLEALANLDTTGIFAALQSPRIPPASELYFTSSELGRLLASQSGELINFFTDALDGESFYYQLKTQSIRIRSPLINLLGATTPGSLAQILPRGATEHGFLSRLVFVYAEQPTTRNPSPVEWKEDRLHLKETMLQRIETTFESIDGPLALTEAAQKTYEDAYLFRPSMRDVRFQAYIQRRNSDHLLKLAAAIALMNGAEGHKIRASDMRLAQGILCMTEAYMERSFAGLQNDLQNRIYLAASELIESNLPARTVREEVYNKLAHLGHQTELMKQLSNLQTLERFKENGKYIDHDRALSDAAMVRPFAWYQGVESRDEFVPMNKPRGELNVVAGKEAR